MTTPPEPSDLPAHLRPLAVEIPRTWTPEEAFAVFELIDELRDKICALCLGLLRICFASNAPAVAR